MAELPAYLFTRQLQRQPTGSQGGNAPARSGIGDVAGGARGLGNVGREIERAGLVVAKVAEKMKHAQNFADEAEGFGAGLQIIEESLAAVNADLMIKPRMRAPTFLQQTNDRIDQALQGYSDEVRGRIMLRLAPRITAEEGVLRDKGQKDFVANTKAAVDIPLLQLQRAELRATNDLDIARIHESQRALISGLVVNGFLTQTEGQNKLQELRDNTRILKLRTAMRSDPALVLTHLQDLAGGGKGIEGMPKPEPEELPALLDEAQKEAGQQLAFENAQERQMLKKQTQESDILRSKFVEDLITSRDDPRTIRQILDAASAARSAGELIGNDPDTVQRLGLQLIEHRTEEQRNSTDPDVLKQYFRHLLDDPKSAENFVINHTGQGLGVGSATGLFGTARKAIDDNHFRNLREVKDTIAFIEDQLGTTGDPMLDAVVSVELSGIKSDAILEFLTRIHGVAGKDGLDKKAVLEALPIIRDQIVQTHRQRLKAIVQQQPSTVGTPQTASIRDAVRQWRMMIKRGVSKYEADAFLGRELARHSAIVGPEERGANAAAIAAELEQALKEEGQ